MIQRNITGVNAGLPHQGFLGPGHTATAVIDGNRFEATDPFILLMDDRLNLPGGPPVGGPHPHAGFETVTLVLKGDEKDWETNSMELMTAGKGVVHTEEITSKTQMRILQLWLVLPPEQRWAEPFVQRLAADAVPRLIHYGKEIRVYSGKSNGLVSPLRNQTPLTIVDFKLEKDMEAVQELPGNYNGFIYVIEGTVLVGDKTMRKGETGWLDRVSENSDSEVRFLAGSQGARFILYAGEPQNAPIVSHGPFIGDTVADIERLYMEYRRHKMPHVNDLPQDRRIIYAKKQAPVH